MRRPGLGCASRVALVLLALTLGCAAPPAAPAAELPTPRPSPMEARTRDAAPVPLGAPQPAAGLFVRVDLPGLDDESDIVAAEVGQAVHGRVLLGNYSLFHGFRVACLGDRSE